MPRYTADAVALLAYLVDALPDRVDRVFAEAEAGETVIRAPGTALAEAMYSVSRDKDVRGVTLTGSPERAREALVDSGPVTVDPVGGETLAEYSRLVDGFSIHDGLVVASHRAGGTDAVLTTDGVIREAGVETLWS